MALICLIIETRYKPTVANTSLIVALRTVANGDYIIVGTEIFSLLKHIPVQ
jgi:hypothetical protein